MSSAPRWFAVAVLGPRCGRDGVIRTGGARQLADRWRRVGPRRSCSDRLARRYLADLAAAGLLERGRRPAPGRPATYRIRFIRAVVRVWPRPRGAASRLIHALFTREQRNPHETGPP